MPRNPYIDLKVAFLCHILAEMLWLYLFNNIINIIKSYLKNSVVVPVWNVCKLQRNTAFDLEILNYLSSTSIFEPLTQGVGNFFQVEKPREGVVKLKFWPPARGIFAAGQRRREKCWHFNFFHEQASLYGLCSKGCYIIFPGPGKNIFKDTHPGGAAPHLINNEPSLIAIHYKDSYLQYFWRLWGSHQGCFPVSIKGQNFYPAPSRLPADKSQDLPIPKGGREK